MRRFWFWFLSVAGILTFLACAGFFLPIEIGAVIFFGWIPFLWRVLPQASVDVAGVATGIAALALFVAGAHFAARWLYGELKSGTQSSEVGSKRGDWKFPWTVSLVAVLLLMFCAGTAVVGVAHQFVWITRSNEPFLESGRRAGRLTHSKNNLKQIGLAFHNYHDVDKALPAGGTFDALGRPLHGWQTALLPFVDQRGLYEKIDLDLPWDHAANRGQFATFVPAYFHSGFRQGREWDDAGFALSHYTGNSRLLSANSAWKFDEITDGTSTTILGGEVNANFKPWGHPLNFRDPAKGINKSPDGFGGPWEGGAHFLFADGSVRFVAENINAKTLQALSTPAGGKPIGEF